MLSKLAFPRKTAPSIAMLLTLASTLGVAADEPRTVQNPNFVPRPAVMVIDFSPNAEVSRAPKTSAYPDTGSTFADLDDYILTEDPTPVDRGDRTLPEGLSQVGGMVVPTEMLNGAAMVGDASRDLTATTGPTLGDPAEFCAFPDEVPPGVYDYDARPGGETPRFHTVFLNYNGGVLNTGAENSAENLSNIAISGHQYPVYGGGEERAIAVGQAVASDLQDWAVRVMYMERPPKVLPYTMVMIGGSYSDTTAGPSGGVAPLDCEDFGQRNVCYAFQNIAPAAQQANVASQEIGHTLGLGHTSASDSVMAAGYASTQPGDLGFNDTCAPTINLQGQGAACVGVNKCHCGDGEFQHDKNTLFATFAPAGVDITPPTIALLQPEDGAMFLPEDAIRVEFDPWDDVGGYGWKIVLTNLDTGEELLDQVDYDRALELDLVGLPDGTYEIKAVVMDHADQTGEDSVIISVGTPSEGTGGEDGGSGSDEGDAGGTDDGAGTGADAGDADDESGNGDVDADDVSDDSGCNCRTDSPLPGGWAALGLLALLGFRRRD